MAGLNFDARSVDPNVSLEPVPAAWYNVQIEKSEMKPTRGGDGAYLELEMVILEGQYKGRKLFDRLNLQNKNETAVEISYRTLSAICHATGVIQVQDSQQLHNIPMEARVVVETDDSGQYDPSNSIRNYRALGAGTQAGPGQQQPAPMGGQQPGFGQPQQQPQPQAQPQQQPAQQQPQQQWEQPNQQPQQQPQQSWDNGGGQQPQQQPQQQSQPAQGDQPWNQPAQQNSPPAEGNQAGQPVGGPAPSAGMDQSAPPWGTQPAQQ